MFRRLSRAALAATLLLAAACATPVLAQSTPQSSPPSRNYAPGFSQRAPESRLVIVAPDLELYSQSVGGVLEPKADWTDAALKNFRSALQAHKTLAAASAQELKESDLDELGQLNALHGAVAEAVFVHHMLRAPELPTKERRLEWTLGEAVQPLRAKTGADYALFFWIRDSYATAERKAAMVAMAVLFGAVMPLGQQVGYASLVDLRDGRIVWFNNLARGSGDLREAQPALETVDVLLKTFPAAR